MHSPSAARLWQSSASCWRLLHCWALACCLKRLHWSLSAPLTSTCLSARYASAALSILGQGWEGLAGTT